MKGWIKGIMNKWMNELSSEQHWEREDIDLTLYIFNKKVWKDISSIDKIWRKKLIKFIENSVKIEYLLWILNPPVRPFKI